MTVKSKTHRLVRFDEMVPCKTAFIDARTPGSDQKENFCLIGDGLAENPDQVVHIKIPHGFNIGAARQPFGCKNSHHSHDTEEVFIVFSGIWKFTWGDYGKDGEVVLNKGDVVSLPAKMFRGFEYIGQGKGLMFSILGLDEHGSAGNVLWAPYVFEEAKKYGLALLEDGRLIDTAAGQSIPDGASIMQATTEAQVEALRRLSLEDMDECVCLQNDLLIYNQGGLSDITGVEEIAIIGVDNYSEAIKKGRISWPHGFHLRRIIIQPTVVIDQHLRYEEEVLILHSGELSVILGNDAFTLTAGDLLTVPIGETRKYINNSAHVADIWVVRRGNNPKAAHFLN